MKSQCTKRKFGFKKSRAEMSGCTVSGIRICSRLSKQILMNYLESGLPLSGKVDYICDMFKAETNHRFHQGHLAFGRLG